MQYVIENDMIPIVSQYKYLGCVINEHLELNDMVQEEAMAGKKALGAWFSRCRVEVGDTGVGTFRKLMSSLMESTMLYGAEIWGCNRNLEGVEQTQLRALRKFFGVGTLHPKVSLLAEMGDLPVRLRAQCVLFWVRVLSSRMYDGWLIRQVATEAVKFGRGSWLRKMGMCCKEFGWKDVSMEGVRGLSNAEVKEMLESIAWRKTREEWGREIKVKPKLTMLKKITDLEEWAGA